MIKLNGSMIYLLRRRAGMNGGVEVGAGPLRKIVFFFSDRCFHMMDDKSLPHGELGSFF